MLFFVGVLSASAQPPVQQVLSFFDTNGTIRMETEELNAAADTLVTVFHRKDDVVWARMTYRIIDLRYKQNYQLYFPTEPDDPIYQSLIRLILDAVAKGMPIYQPDPLGRTFVPSFTEDFLLTGRRLNDFTGFGAVSGAGTYEKGEEGGDLIYYDTINNRIVLELERYPAFTHNLYRYLIQEVYFFDKHTSRMHRQIVAIAPMNLMLQAGEEPPADPMESLKKAVSFWILYKDLRPYVAKQYMIPLQNTTKRVTFDDFFQKKLYSSYLVGETNIYNRMILDYAKSEAEAKKEQARIEEEYLNFEQDLWEY